ncbi:MAG: phosphatidylinositol kinase [Bacteroidetes bacterium HGW-Bacteroidetes-16]|jgi:serine/threonine-protein kinase HipA|nr:MAG: phosphatidylinositol kinase [Bacteroidetes bacterium HGW-Bacteroidetes-16]
MNNRCLYCYKELNDGLDFHRNCSMEFFGTKEVPELPYSLDQMSELAKNVVERSVSVPGVQAKLSLSLIKEAQRKNNRLTVVGALGGNYIFKPPNNDYPEMPQNEHATMRLAEAMGLKVVPSSLIRLQSGELSYITKRIDRTPEGVKIHMLDMFQLTEAYDKYKSSMEKIGKAISKYSDNTLLDLLYFFELTIFSFLTGNNDMHLKNFSLINSSFGWILSPAYDLLNVSVLNPKDKEELALPIDGKKNKLKRMHFELFGSSLGLNSKQISGVFNRYQEHSPIVESIIDQSFLSIEMKSKYLKLFHDRHAVLFL